MKIIKIRAKINEIEITISNYKEWNKDLALWKDKWDWQSVSQINPKEKSGTPKLIKLRWRERHNTYQ